MTAPVDLDHLDALAKAATPGPWIDVHETCAGKPNHFIGYDPPGYHSSWTRVVSTAQSTVTDAAYIVATRNAYPAMSAELRLLRNVVEGQARLLDTAVRPDTHKATCVRLEMATERAETAERELAETRADRDVWTRRTAVAERELAKAEAERDEYARALLVNE